MRSAGFRVRLSVLACVLAFLLGVGSFLVQLAKAFTYPYPDVSMALPKACALAFVASVAWMFAED